MTKRDDGGPAFPFEYHNQTASHQPGFYGTGALAPGASQQFGGMSLRDWFAGQALPAIIRQCAGDLAFNNPDRLELATYFARKAYECADAMLEALAKEASDADHR